MNTSGIKSRACNMIFCHSVVRKPNSPKGRTIQPKARDKSIVLVVIPNRADAATARVICRQTKVPSRRPSKESQLKPQRVRPEEKKRCIRKVKSNNQRSIKRSRRICIEKGLTAQAELSNRIDAQPPHNSLSSEPLHAAPEARTNHGHHIIIVPAARGDSHGPPGRAGRLAGGDRLAVVPIPPARSGAPPLRLGVPPQ